jgi:hypothetical protein
LGEQELPAASATNSIAFAILELNLLRLVLTIAFAILELNLLRLMQSSFRSFTHVVGEVSGE